MKGGDLLKLTVAEILSLPEFADFKLIAGADGISNAVTACGILDYEYDRMLKNKYTRISFIPHQMILSSLQYAKDDPGCLIDAVRLLHHRQCSCLVVKNVYSLTIPPHVLRFADSVGFPIILIKNAEQYFERIIITVYQHLQGLRDFDKYEDIVARIITLPERDPQQKELQRAINPCLQPDLFCIYFRAEHALLIDDYMAMEEAMKGADLLTSYNTLLRYRDGLLFIHSSHNFKNARTDELAAQVLKSVGAAAEGYRIGVSSIPYRARKVRRCIQEAIYSSYFHLVDTEPYQTYEKLGVRSILLPYCREAPMQHFAASILTPIRDYDAEYHTSLMETVHFFVRHGGNIAATAQEMGQHKNTIRYRMNQISQILGGSVLVPEGYERLSLALNIEMCSEISLLP